MKVIKFLSVVLVAFVLFSCNKGFTKKPLKTEVDSVSYAVGMQMGKQIKANFEEADKDIYLQGILNALDSLDLLMDDETANKVVRDYFTKKQQEKRKEAEAKRLKETEEKYNDNKVASENFLEENKAKDGVQTTASGLQYIVLKEGSGEKPAGPTAKVKVHYHGTTINGEVFDSSVDRGTPYETPLNQVIKGWTEGVQLMPVGSKYKFFIPQELAYGASPRPGGKIKPFDALIFEIELLEILDK